MYVILLSFFLYLIFLNYVSSLLKLKILIFTSFAAVFVFLLSCLSFFHSSSILSLSFLSACLSVCTHVLLLLQQDGVPWNLIFGTFMKIFRETPDFIKIGQQYRTLHEDLSTFCCCWRNTFTIRAFIMQQSMFLYCWQWLVGQQYTQDALLLFNCNIAPQCYVIHVR